MRVDGVDAPVEPLRDRLARVALGDQREHLGLPLAEPGQTGPLLSATGELEEGSDEAVGELLAQYGEDGSAMWLYSRALWAFRQEGASKNANKHLSEALRQNGFLPAYLAGKKALPRHLPEYFSPGQETEAIAYAVDGIRVWAKTEGALEWLESNLPKSPRRAGGQWVRG